MASNLAKSKVKRTVLRSSTTKLENKIVKILEADESDLKELRVLIGELCEKQDQNEKLNTQIEDLITDLEELQKDVEESQKYSEKLIRIKIEGESKLKECLELQNRNIHVKDIDSTLSIPNSKPSVNLPKFDLPTFNGNIEDWLSYKQIFITTIHDNSSLTDLQKLQYLKASIVGSANKLIKGFPITESSYNEAWATLISRFDNKKNLAYAQLNKFFNSKPLKANCRKSILELLDNCNEAVRNLKCLEFEFNSFVDLILVYTLQTKLDDSLRRQWELSLDNETFPTYEKFILFLEKQARSLQDVHEVYSKVDSKSKVGFKKSISNTVISNSGTKSSHLTCPECSENHALHKCSHFLKKSVEERWNSVKTKKLCVNCLRKNHYVSKCLISMKCHVCQGKHHSLLHYDKSIPVIPSVAEDSNNCVNTNIPSSVNSSCLASTHSGYQTLLSTAIVLVKSKSGNFVPCRALVDSGSQKTLISKVCSQKLGLPVKTTNHKISGVNNILAETSLFEVNLVLKSSYGNEIFNVDALVVNNVTVNLPNFNFHNSSWPHLEGLQLADPNFYVSSPIDLLIGADLFPLIILGQSILGPKGTPCALNSKLGWLLSGVIHSNPSQNPKSIVNCHATVQLTDDLQKFWEIESIPNIAPIQSSEDLYAKTVSRTQNGRYMVNLPFKENPKLGDSETNALKRFHFLESKLEKNPKLKKQYHSFMQEYLELNHMEPVPKSDLDSNKICFYMPHHGVIKEDSTTTKLRVVFDASAVASSGHSLNDFLEVGPKLQPDLLKLLLKFRSYPVALTGDIEKMYRQILVNPEHVDFQRIFWRFHPYEPISSYRLLTVTYGTACAPFLAIRTLHQLSKDYSLDFPLAARVILEDFYVDDLLSGAQSNEKAKQLISDLNHVLNQGGFTLRKWASNVPSILSNLPEELKSTTQNVNFSEDSSQKILGLVWNSSEDVLKIHITSFNSVQTKRELLSTIARIFDPLGILSPTTIMLKIMMQELWKDKLSWDDPIPNSIENTWKEFSSQIDLLKCVGINRYLRAPNSPDSHIQLHGFCDGSGKAYAAVIYLRTISSLGEISVNFVAAKTRVNPIKHVTLPRIELCAAFLLTQLCSTIIEAVPFSVNEIFLWSDSQIVLNWINSPPSKGNQFVTNRANQIKSLVPQAVWTYVPSSSNPADCASRGIFPKKLLVHKLWWNGPEWLQTDVNLPLSLIKPSLDSSSTSEKITNHVALSHDKAFPEFLLKFSSYSKLCRVIAFCLRFIYNASHPDTKRTGALSAIEVSNATNSILKQIQEHEFPSELKLLKNNQPLPPNNKFLTLNIFLDEQGFIRVGGRLSRHQSLNQDQKHPILLPKNHPITKLLIQHYHRQHFHAGTQLILSLIRQKFWFVNGRSLIRHVLKDCILCKRIKKQLCQQIMGELPVERITPVRPFSKVGIDFAGPIITKPNMPRSKTKLKSYICVIVCMCTKAIHLEAVSDLSSQALLAALRRFIARRGLPSDIFSDNGKNFKGVANHFKQLFQILRSEDIQNFATTSFINWHFIPPYSPHFGGLWEAAVKLTKNLLVKACKMSILNFEELSTLLCQIEACLNSRPLTPLSSDPSDVRALTPGHFLIGVPLLEIPETGPSNTLNLSSRWMLIQKIKKNFWCRWSRDYLHHLQQRPKWCSQKPNIQVGDLVVIHDSQSPPLFWRLGRILQTFPGPDNQVRVVSIRTKDGEVKRPISKVTFLLPGAEDV